MLRHLASCDHFYPLYRELLSIAEETKAVDASGGPVRADVVRDVARKRPFRFGCVYGGEAPVDGQTVSNAPDVF